MLAVISSWKFINLDLSQSVQLYKNPVILIYSYTAWIQFYVLHNLILLFDEVNAIQSTLAFYSTKIRKKPDGFSTKKDIFA